MAVPQNAVRIGSKIYPTDRHGRVEVRDIISGVVKPCWPIDIRDALAMGDNCPIEIVTKPIGDEVTIGEIQTPGLFATSGPARDIPVVSGAK